MNKHLYAVFSVAVALTIITALIYFAPDAILALADKYKNVAENRSKELATMLVGTFFSCVGVASALVAVAVLDHLYGE